MKGIEDRVKAIVIPSGGTIGEDLERTKRAIQYNKENGLNLPYMISGIGPDTYLALQGENPDRELDFHKELYEYMMSNTEGVFGLDVLSVNSVGNILNTFPEGTSGTYLMVSYPLHLMKLKLILRAAQKRGRVSKDVRIKPVLTRQSLRQFLYGIASMIKGMKDLKKI